MEREAFAATIEQAPRGIADDLERLHRDLLRHVATIGHGRWRVAQDAVDAAFERAIDRWLADGLTAEIAAIRAYAYAVLRNLVRRGPTRVELDRLRIATLADDAIGERPLRPSVPRAAWIAPPSLTTAEHAAVQAVTQCGSHRRAAAACGMTPRDLRVRLRRAAAKIRAQLA